MKTEIYDPHNHHNVVDFMECPANARKIQNYKATKAQIMSIIENRGKELQYADSNLHVYGVKINDQYFFIKGGKCFTFVDTQSGRALAYELE